MGQKQTITKMGQNVTYRGENAIQLEKTILRKTKGSKSITIWNFEVGYKNWGAHKRKRRNVYGKKNNNPFLSHHKSQ